MKRYSIDNADQMKAVAPLMKRKEAVWNAHNAAVVWSTCERRGKPVPFKVYIDVGRNATLHRTVNGTPIYMGEMQLTATRNYVKSLKEVPLT